MTKALGTIGSFVLAMLTFRLVYGAWPPFKGDFVDWLASDLRAVWALLAGIAGLVVGGIIGQSIGKAISKEE